MKKILGIKADSNLNFQEYLNTILRKQPAKSTHYQGLLMVWRLKHKKKLMNVFHTLHNSTITLFPGCFITVAPTVKLIAYMKKVLASASGAHFPGPGLVREFFNQ